MSARPFRSVPGLAPPILRPAPPARTATRACRPPLDALGSLTRKSLAPSLQMTGTLIEIDEARRVVLRRALTLQSEPVGLAGALGRVLAVDVVCAEAVP